MTRRQLLRLGGLAPLAPRALAAAPSALSGTYSNLLPAYPIALPYSPAAVRGYFVAFVDTFTFPWVSLAGPEFRIVGLEPAGTR